MIVEKKYGIDIIGKNGMAVGVQHLLNEKCHIEYWEKEGINNI